MTESDFDAVLQVHLKGSFNVSRAAALLGVDRNTVRTALGMLARAALVTMRNLPGQPMEVTINDAHPDDCTTRP